MVTNNNAARVATHDVGHRGCTQRHRLVRHWYSAWWQKCSGWSCALFLRCWGSMPRRRRCCVGNVASLLCCVGDVGSAVVLVSCLCFVIESGSSTSLRSAVQMASRASCFTLLKPTVDVPREPE
jgi:hypothetical protein